MGRGSNHVEAQLTRRELVGLTALLAAPVVLGGVLHRAAAAAVSERTLAISQGQLAQVRRNVFQLKLPFARRAWANTLARANDLTSYAGAPTSGRTEITDWRSQIYSPGLHDGNAALTLAQAYAIGGRETYAQNAKRLCLAWARAYQPLPPLAKVEHMVAEPVGPVIKLCMAYDLAKPVFSQVERDEFASWASLFVERAKGSVNQCRDDPWVPDVDYEGDSSNPVPYGNGATWQRAMAVWAAAVVGGATLRETLEWNWRHTSARGRDYGWDNLIEGLVIDGTGGRLVEERYRSSIHYGHFSWIPAVLIADLARNASFRVDLFTYKTKRHGYTIFTPVSYYSGFVTKPTIADGREQTQYGGSEWPNEAQRTRAMYEILYRNARRPADVERLRAVVHHGGARQRGDNYDVYVFGNGATFGRGPKGPRG